MIEGRGPSPALVIPLVQRLPDTSLTAALMSGGREFFQWGVDRHMAADLYDAVNANTRATGNFKKPPTIPPYPRPKAKQADKKPRSLKDVYSMFSARKG